LSPARRKKLSDPELPILPSTKVAALLDRYPELEDVLIALAPPFEKLKNPFLRKGVAKVASLQQAAVVAGMPVAELVNKLRAAVGQPPIASNDPGVISYFVPQPEWFSPAKIVGFIDESAADPDKMPIVSVLQQAAELQPGDILELVTAFVPAPGIEIMKTKGLLVWSRQESPKQIRTYVSKPQR
jgi:hypothetical protein